jgi:serine protease
VEVAGNGSADLDSAAYNNAFNRNVRDSGAILVGASLSDQRSPTCWTNFGTRVDVHGWGENVVTMGYGDLFTGDHNKENQFYTAQFSGTSSASPIIVGSAASIQGVANNLGLAQFDSMAMRELLVGTGTVQTGDLARNIGPLPNIRAAIESINTQLPPPRNFNIIIQ